MPGYGIFRLYPFELGSLRCPSQSGLGQISGVLKASAYSSVEKSIATATVAKQLLSLASMSASAESGRSSSPIAGADLAPNEAVPTKADGDGFRTMNDYLVPYWWIP